MSNIQYTTRQYLQSILFRCTLTSTDITELQKLIGITINTDTWDNISDYYLNYIIEYYVCRRDIIIKNLINTNKSKEHEIKLYQEYISDVTITNDDNCCMICMDKPTNIILNCGHKICSLCKNNLKSQICPYCRMTI